MNDLMSVVEVADYLKIHKLTVQQWCRTRELPAAKIGKQYRIRRSELERWYESKRTGAA